MNYNSKVLIILANIDQCSIVTVRSLYLFYDHRFPMSQEQWLLLARSVIERLWVRFSPLSLFADKNLNGWWTCCQHARLHCDYPSSNPAEVYRFCSLIAAKTKKLCHFAKLLKVFVCKGFFDQIVGKTCRCQRQIKN